MKQEINTIEIYLRNEFSLFGEQLLYELKRFERNLDIGAELALALKHGKFPRKTRVSVSYQGKVYTAKKLYQKKYAESIYAAYSLLSQLRECPDIIINAMEKGFQTK